jgi:hypothetical protein
LLNLFFLKNIQLKTLKLKKHLNHRTKEIKIMTDYVDVKYFIIIHTHLFVAVVECRPLHPGRPCIALIESGELQPEPLWN